MKIYCSTLVFLLVSLTIPAALAVGAKMKFIDFAKENINANDYDKQMGASFEAGIAFVTQHWSIDKAESFISNFEDRIGKKVLLERIKNLSLRNRLFDLEGFYARIGFYESFLGEEEVTKKLKQSFAGFDSGSLEMMESLAGFLEMVLDRETVISMMKEDIRPFSEIPNLKAITIFGNFSLFMGKENAKKIIKENLNVFIEAERSDLEQKLDAMAKYAKIALQYLPITDQKEILAEAITSDFKAFASLDLKTFEETIRYLRDRFYLTDGEIFSMIKRELGVFSKMQLDSTKELIRFIENEIHLINKQNSQEVLSKLIYNDPKILSDIDLNNFKNAFAHLENHINKAETVHLMIKHFSLFYKIDFDELIQITSLLYDLLGKEGIRFLIVKESEAFLKLKKEKLEGIMNWMKPLNEEGLLFLKERAAQKELLSFFDYMNDLELEEIKSNAQKKQILEDYLNSQKPNCPRLFAN